MISILYIISKITAVASGVLLALPYILQLEKYVDNREIDVDTLKQNAPFTIAILGFTFSAYVNYIKFDNWAILLAQLFSTIPLIILHIIALTKGR